MLVTWFETDDVIYDDIIYDDVICNEVILNELFSIFSNTPFL